MNDNRTATPYILDLYDQGSKLLFAIKTFCPYRVNHWASKQDYLEEVKKIYVELTIQVLLAISDQDELHCMYAIMALPDVNALKHHTIYQIEMESELNTFKEAVKRFAMFLYHEVNYRVNPGPNKVLCDYQLDSITETLIVIARYERFQ